MLKESYLKVTHKSLPINNGDDVIAAFSNCPYAIASHDTNSVFNYANKASLQLFKTNWDEMIGKHSSLSASESSQSDRNRPSSVAPLPRPAVADVQSDRAADRHHLHDDERAPRRRSVDGPGRAMVAVRW